MTGKLPASRPWRLLWRSSRYTPSRRSSMPPGATTEAGSRRWRASASCCARSVAGTSAMGCDRAGSGVGALQGTDPPELVQQFVERREIEIALEQGRPQPVHAIGLGQQLPGLVPDRGAVGVDLQVRGLVVVAGDVVAGDPRRRHPAQERSCVVAVVDRIDVDVVDV